MPKFKKNQKVLDSGLWRIAFIDSLINFESSSKNISTHKYSIRFENEEIIRSIDEGFHYFFKSAFILNMRDSFFDFFSSIIFRQKGEIKESFY